MCVRARLHREALRDQGKSGGGENLTPITKGVKFTSVKNQKKAWKPTSSTQRNRFKKDHREFFRLKVED